MAILRRTAVSALRRAGFNQIAARLRHNARRPEDALKVLGLAPMWNANALLEMMCKIELSASDIQLYMVTHLHQRRRKVLQCYHMSIQ